MQKLFPLVLACSLAGKASSQGNLHHYGGMQFHEGAQVGLYLSLVNQGPFEQQGGLLGFYGENQLEITGSFAPVFYDVEIFNPGGVQVDQSISISNSINFIDGDFRTPRGIDHIYVAQLQNALTAGVSDDSKVDGYAVAIDQDQIVFPVGDALQYRPLTLEGKGFPLVRCAYFRENPDRPSTLPPYRVDIKPRSIEAVSTTEFWRLLGTGPGNVTLTWNPESNLGALSEDLSKIRILAWKQSEGRWVTLETDFKGGDIANGFIRSGEIELSNFEAYTFGSEAVPSEMISAGNYFLSPNGDGINDRLILEELEDSRNNRLQIYDRNGLKVFDMVNYTDQFAGISNLDNLILNPEKGLPEGVYFFLVQIFDTGLELQGYLFLDR